MAPRCDRLHDPREQHLADTQRAVVDDHLDLVQAPVDARILLVEVVSGQDDVEAVEEEDAHCSGGRGQRE
jgi:hypothetical protein